MQYRLDVPTPTFVPSPEIARAIGFAIDHHGAQTRKGTAVPYLQHLLGVASIAMEHGATETETIAAVLHDVIEDTDVDERRLAEAFGPDVTVIVAECSAETKTGGDPAESWRARKLSYIDQLAKSSPSAVLVSLADKIHNARSLAADHRRLDDEVWGRLNAGRQDQVWYYRSLIDTYERRVDENASRISPDMVEELRRAVVSFA